MKNTLSLGALALVTVAACTPDRAATDSKPVASAGAESVALVGIGCEGTSGLIYAAGEDDFPRCESIERNLPIWRPVIVYRNGESDWLQGATLLAICDAALEPYDGRPDIEVSYCEKLESK